MSKADLQSLDVAVCWHAKDNDAACDYQAAQVGLRSSQPTRVFIAHILHTGCPRSSCLQAQGSCPEVSERAALRPPWLTVLLLLAETGAPCRYLKALTRPGLARAPEALDLPKHHTVQAQSLSCYSSTCLVVYSGASYANPWQEAARHGTSPSMPGPALRVAVSRHQWQAAAGFSAR